jgi:signal transduction histidine kinase
VEQIFDLPQREWVPNAQHHRKADDLGTGPEVLEGRALGHERRLRDRPGLSARKQAEKAKMDFLAIVSHELRTPLTTIIGYVSFLSSPEILPAARKLTGALSTQGEQGAEARGLLDDFLKETASYAQRAKLSGDHLRELVNSILDFSKIYAGKMELNIKEVTVGSVLSEIVDQFDREARAKALDVSCEVSVDTVMADEVRLRQILINLIGNAVKFTDTGCIAVEVEKYGQFVEFRVTDTGPGLAETDQDKLFELFTQIDASTTRQKGGTGLGLTIAKQLAELHGGEIGVSSEPGEGSTFWFRLPAKQSQGWMPNRI